MIVRAEGRRSGRVAFPIVGGRIRHHALHRRGGVVAGLGGGCAAVFRRHHHAAAIGIQQHLGRIEPHPARRIGRPMHAIAIELARLHSRHECVPVVIGPVDVRIQFDGPAGPGVVRPVEEQQFHARGGAREQAEVRAAAAEGGAERMAAAGLESCFMRIGNALKSAPSLQRRLCRRRALPGWRRSCAQCPTGPRA